jgi:hypothetical protein
VLTITSKPLQPLYRSLDLAKTKAAPFYLYHWARYTFILNLFRAYKMDQKKEEGEDPLDLYLQKLQAPYIWNIYKILTQEYLQKAASLTFQQR